ncbi:hypothetical protein [Streptomyces sp. NPDC004579]|uniref:hypothetical protein n=1 Tax=Streptomyces sp. NPDC004579 TaxID=3154667 RepID=UPI00339E3EEB
MIQREEREEAASEAPKDRRTVVPDVRELTRASRRSMVTASRRPKGAMLASSFFGGGTALPAAAALRSSTMLSPGLHERAHGAHLAIEPAEDAAVAVLITATDLRSTSRAASRRTDGGSRTRDGGFGVIYGDSRRMPRPEVQ